MSLYGYPVLFIITQITAEDIYRQIFKQAMSKRLPLSEKDCKTIKTRREQRRRIKRNCYYRRVRKKIEFFIFLMRKHAKIC